MKHVIEAGYVNYNANTDNKSVGDCTVRALCFAAGKDYSEVRSELNRIKRENGYRAFNDFRTLLSYIETYFDAKEVIGTWAEELTIDDFCNKHPNGVYVVLCGKYKNYLTNFPTHMACIIDGNVYDSWDSRDRYVTQAWELQNISTEIQYAAFVTVEYDLADYLHDYIESVVKKYEWIENFDMWHRVRSYDEYGGSLTVMITYKEAFDVPQINDIYAGKTRTKRFEFKMNPRMSLEDNLAVMKKKGKQRIYDWLYNCNHEFQTMRKKYSGTFSKHVVTMRDKEQAAQLPEWVWPLIRFIEFEPSYNHYYVSFEALPEDPMQKPVLVEEATLGALKRALENYRNTFNRGTYQYSDSFSSRY